MNAAGTIAMVAGLGAAGYLYIRSQQRQQAALAAASAPVSPVDKILGAVEKYGGQALSAASAAFQGVPRALTSAASTVTAPVASTAAQGWRGVSSGVGSGLRSVASGASTVTSFVGGLF